MTKEQIEQAANALAVNEYPILADGPIAREKERTIHNKIVRAFIAGATSPEAKAYHEGEKDEAIRELVKGLRYIEEKNYPNNTPDNYIRNYKNHTKSSLLTLPLSGIKNLLCDVSQLIAGWNATDSEWSDWDEGVRKRVSELQNKIDVYGNVLFAQDYESPIRENT